MDIPQKLQEFLENTRLSIEMLRCADQLLKANNELNKHREQCDIRTDHYLLNVNVITERTNEQTNEQINEPGIKKSLVFIPMNGPKLGWRW